PAQTTTPTTTGSVSGRVVDADTQIPIPDVTVRAVIRSGSRSGVATAFNSAPTDADGRYVIQRIPSGQVAVLIENGTTSTTDVVPRNVTIVGGSDTSNVDFQARMRAQVWGRVL